MIEKKIKQKLDKKIKYFVLLYNFLLIAVVAIFYFAIPVLLNYPPNSINNEFETMIDMGWKYFYQYSGIVILSMIISNAFLFSQIKKIDGWEEIASGQLIDKSKKERIKYTCFVAPGKLYVGHVLFPITALVIGLLLTGAGVVLTLKISICMLAIFLSLGLLIYVLTKDFFSDILIELKSDKVYKVKHNVTTYKERILLQVLPLIIFMGAFIYLSTMSVCTDEKSDLIFEKYYSKLTNSNIGSSRSINELSERLNLLPKENEEDVYFILKDEETVYCDVPDTSLSDFFIKYIYHADNNNKSYDYYASDIQGAYITVNLEDGIYVVGIRYAISYDTNYLLILFTFIVLFSIIICFLTFFANDFARPINQVSEYMHRLAAGNTVDYSQKLPIVSNDEVGILTTYFNNLLDVEKYYMATLKKNQEMLVENERLSSLGQLIGGIAHNLKTPIMSVSGYLTGLEKLAEEYKDSIGNPDVTEEDFEEITNEMKEIVDKSRDYLSYMTEVINAAKGQAVSMNANEMVSFTMHELIARTEILMREEVKKYNCNLNIKLNANDSTKIKGELSAIIQVLNNLISNAIQAYTQKNGEVNLIVDEDDMHVFIMVQDFAGGIADNVKEKLFKEMITTKGKDGTGLGLYMCYSTIKGRFDGDLRFESEKGKGTTFYITLNKI